MEPVSGIDHLDIYKTVGNGFRGGSRVFKFHPNRKITITPFLCALNKEVNNTQVKEVVIVNLVNYEVEQVEEEEYTRLSELVIEKDERHSHYYKSKTIVLCLVDIPNHENTAIMWTTFWPTLSKSSADVFVDTIAVFLMPKTEECSYTNSVIANHQLSMLIDCFALFPSNIMAVRLTNLNCLAVNGLYITATDSFNCQIRKKYQQLLTLLTPQETERSTHLIRYLGIYGLVCDLRSIMRIACLLKNQSRYSKLCECYKTHVANANCVEGINIEQDSIVSVFNVKQLSGIVSHEPSDQKEYSSIYIYRCLTGLTYLLGVKKNTYRMVSDTPVLFTLFLDKLNEIIVDGNAPKSVRNDMLMLLWDGLAHTCLRTDWCGAKYVQPYKLYGTLFKTHKIGDIVKDVFGTPFTVVRTIELDKAYEMRHSLTSELHQCIHNDCLQEELNDIACTTIDDLKVFPPRFCLLRDICETETIAHGSPDHTLNRYLRDKLNNDTEYLYDLSGVSEDIIVYPTGPRFLYNEFADESSEINPKIKNRQRTTEMSCESPYKLNTHMFPE